MTERVDLEYPTTTRDSYGGQSKTWTKKATVWAFVDFALEGQEMDTDRVMSRSSLTLRIHYRSDITAQWRIKWDGAYYQVRGVDNTDRRRRFTKVMAVSEVAY